MASTPLNIPGINDAPPSAPAAGGKANFGTKNPTTIGSLPDSYQQPGSIVGGGPYTPVGITPTPYGTTPITPGEPGTISNQGGTYYIDGQEWAPLNDPTSIPTLQAELVQAGLLTKSTVRVGVWDSSAASAYKSALAFANASGLTIKDALGVLIQNQKLGTTKAASASPGPFSISNPEDDKAAFATAAQNLVGQKLPDSEAAKFAQYFQAQERGVNAQHVSDITSGATNSASAPSASTSAEDYIKQNDAAQVAAYGMASRMAEFQSMLGSAQGTL